MLSIYTLEQATQWDAIVRSFKEFDVYWLSGYVKAFQIHGDGEPLLFFYEDGDTRGINVVMKRDIAEDIRFSGKIESGKYFDFSTPYGYGGWLIEGENRKDLFGAYEHWLQERKIVSEFVRFHPMLQNNNYVGDFYEIRQLGEVVHMDLDSPELIWNNIISKNRNMIRKAQKNEIKIYNGRFPEIYKEFRNIYNVTMQKDKAEEYYFFQPAFYESILEDLPSNAQVFYAEKDNKVIAASIILTANGKMNYHLSGSLEEYKSLAPTNLLLYKVALWGNANGYKTLYLGGGVGSGEDSLFKFKRSFYKGDLNHFYIGKKIYNKKIYDELVEYRQEKNVTIQRSEFFPLYRG